MKLKKWVCVLLAVFLLAGLFCMPALAAADDVADAVEQTWGDASEQIKTVVDSVVFPALGMVLAIAFFVKLAMAYFDYRKHGQFFMAWSETSGSRSVILRSKSSLVIASEPHNAPDVVWGQQDEN